MYIDSQLKLSDAQALTATALSTNVIPSSDAVGMGEPMAAVITVGVDASSGASGTYSFAVETDDNAGMASATILATKAVAEATLVAGYKVVIPLGYEDLEGFLAVRYTLGGTTPTITVDAQVMPMSTIDGYQNYADGFDIS